MMPFRATPRSMLSAIPIAWLIGIANPIDAPASLDAAAVSMPTTRPAVSTSGPPESPGWICASVSISPFRRSLDDVVTSLVALID